MHNPTLTASGIQRVSTIELFFDLVFVFAITQLTSMVAHPHGLEDYLRAALVFLTLAWMYGGYTWLTSNVVFSRVWQRQALFAAMAGFFLMALAIPDVFEEDGLVYAIGFLAVTTIHTAMFSTAPNTSSRAIWDIASFNFAAVGFVLVAAFVDPPWDWPLWAAAVGVFVLASVRRREQNFEISPAHFVERNGLLLIVALGESIVAVGLGARELDLNLPVVLMAVFALMLAAAIWWSYFDRDPERAEQKLQSATSVERARMALLGFGYAHFVMIAGIVLIAAGLEVGIAHPIHDTETIGLWNLAIGLAIYLLGDTWYRNVLKIETGRLRPVLAVAVFASVPIGYALGALAQLIACVLILQPLWLLDRSSPRIVGDD